MLGLKASAPPSPECGIVKQLGKREEGFIAGNKRGGDNCLKVLKDQAKVF